MAEPSNANGAKGNSGRRRAIAAFLVAAAATVCAGGFYWWYRGTHVSTDDAFVEGRIHLVAARIPGTVAEVLVDDNQPVRKGQPLLRIDREPYGVRESAAASAVSAASADLAAAGSDIAAARADIQAGSQDLAAAQAHLAQTRAAVDAARARERAAGARRDQADRDADRAKALFDRRSISRERHEKALTESDVVRAQASQAGEELRLAEAAVPAQEALIAQRRAVLVQREAVLAQREARVGQHRATVRQREAALAEARLNGRYTEIAAPADGYVTRRSVEAGQVVSAGQPLLAVASLTDIWVVANYKETQVGKIRPGQAVEIRVDTYPGRRLRGKVESLMAGTGSAFSLFPPENATGNYVKVVQRVPVKIALEKGEDPDRVLRIGMSVVPTVLVR